MTRILCTFGFLFVIWASQGRASEEDSFEDFKSSEESSETTKLLKATEDTELQDFSLLQPDKTQIKLYEPKPEKNTIVFESLEDDEFESNKSSSPHKTITPNSNSLEEFIKSLGCYDYRFKQIESDIKKNRKKLLNYQGKLKKIDEEILYHKVTCTKVQNFLDSIVKHHKPQLFLHKSALEEIEKKTEKTKNLLAEKQKELEILKNKSSKVINIDNNTNQKEGFDPKVLSEALTQTQTSLNDITQAINEKQKTLDTYTSEINSLNKKIKVCDAYLAKQKEALEEYKNTVKILKEKRKLEIERTRGTDSDEKISPQSLKGNTNNEIDSLESLEKISSEQIQKYKSTIQVLVTSKRTRGTDSDEKISPQPLKGNTNNESNPPKSLEAISSEQIEKYETTIEVLVTSKTNLQKEKENLTQKVQSITKLLKEEREKKEAYTTKIKTPSEPLKKQEQIVKVCADYAKKLRELELDKDRREIEIKTFSARFHEQKKGYENSIKSLAETLEQKKQEKEKYEKRIATISNRIKKVESEKVSLNKKIAFLAEKIPEIIKADLNRDSLGICKSIEDRQWIKKEANKKTLALPSLNLFKTSSHSEYYLYESIAPFKNRLEILCSKEESKTQFKNQKDFNQKKYLEYLTNVLKHCERNLYLQAHSRMKNDFSFLCLSRIGYNKAVTYCFADQLIPFIDHLKQQSTSSNSGYFVSQNSTLTLAKIMSRILHYDIQKGNKIGGQKRKYDDPLFNCLREKKNPTSSRKNCLSYLSCCFKKKKSEWYDKDNWYESCISPSQLFTRVELTTQPKKNEDAKNFGTYLSLIYNRSTLLLNKEFKNEESKNNFLKLFDFDSDKEETNTNQYIEDQDE